MIAMKWLKKWSYMLLWVMAGVIYLSVVDDWQVYAKPKEQIKIWYENIVRNMENLRMDDFTEQAGTATYAEGTEMTAGAEPDGSMPAVGEIVSAGEESVAPGVSTSGNDADSPEDAAQSEPPAAGNMQPSDISSAQNVEKTDDEVIYQTVEDDYFADAVFIGDSRTVGMYEYGGLEETADFFASTGLTIYKLFDAEIVPVEGQKKKITVEQALTENSYRKIYLMIGINEMGTGTVESFADAYRAAVDHLLELQPDAILYIQGIMKVTAQRSGQGDYINNEGIEERNEALKQIADNDRIFYLDVNPQICDESGGMTPSYTFDGVHLKAQYIDIWKTFLKERAVVK